MDMTRKYRFEYDQMSGIFYKFHAGPTTYEDIRDSWQFAFEHQLIPESVKGFILDFREAAMEMHEDDHEKIAAFYREHLDVFGNYKFAIVVGRPQDVVIPMLVTELDRGYTSKAFSTMEAARAWVLR